ncbi:MAG: hypothetical protein ACXQTA_00790 [Candidatus Syntropharchaeales archaeon]
MRYDNAFDKGDTGGMRVDVAVDRKMMGILIKRWSVPLIFLSLTLIAILLRLLPYLLHDPFFAVGFDTGMYMKLTSFYVESDSWGILPAYPEFAPSYYPYISQVDAGFLVFSASIIKFSGMDLLWHFQYYLPVFITGFTALVCFMAGQHISRSVIGGFMAVTFFSVSYVQIDSINESYYRLVIATLLIVLASVLLDKFIETGSRKYLGSSIIMFSGTVAYHISAVVIVFAIMFFVCAYLVYKNEIQKMKIVGIGIVGILILSAPVWIPRIDVYIDTFWNMVDMSIWRSSTLTTGEGFWSAGGGIPELFWSYSHILLAYIDVLLPFVVLTVLSYVILFFGKRMHLLLPVLSIFLWVYIALWFFYGNRMLVFLDLLICILMPVTILYIIRLKIRRRQVKFIAILIMILSLFSPIITTFEYQMDKGPYIESNMEGIEWIAENIQKRGSIIFAPDYISINLLQMDYDLAMWDYTLTDQTMHPLRASEEFIVQSPSNNSYLLEFFSDNPRYRELDIYVVWGEADLDRALISSQELIPMEEYRLSDNYELRYEGCAEIHKVYQYVGPRY